MSDSFTILLVDDEKNMLTSMGDILNTQGYKTLKANNGMQAIEIAAKNRVDLTLLDFKMPGLNGLKTYEELKKIIPDLKCIFMTAYYDRSNFDDSHTTRGIISICHKPIDIPELLDHIRLFRKKVNRT